jgi:serine/threonine protein kinase
MGADQGLQVKSEPFIGLPGFTDVVAVASGATSQVFRACQPTMDRLVAIKVLGLTVHDARVRARFERELAVMGRLSRHPLLVTIHSHGISQVGYPYLVMPWYERGSVADELRLRGPMTVSEVLRTGVKVGAALDFMHGQGIVHRDVKPANVLLSDLGESVLADFGGAIRLDRMGTATSTYTPIHAAPELFCGGTASPSSDVWSLTSTLYTALTGKPPFALGSAQGDLMAELSQLLGEPMPELTRSDVPDELVALLQAGLAKQSADRPTAFELADGLQRLQAEQGLPMTEIPRVTVWAGAEAGPAGAASKPGPIPDQAPAGSGSLPPESSAGADTASEPPTESAAPAPSPLVPLIPQSHQSADLPGEATVLRHPPAPTKDRSRLVSLTRIGAGLVAGTAIGAVALTGALSAFHSESASNKGTAKPPAASTSPSAAPSPSAVSTSPDPAPANPANGKAPAGSLTVVGRGATNIALTWQDTNQGRSRYLVIVSPVSGGSSTQRADTNTSHTVRSLQPGTTYCFRVATGDARVAPVTAQLCATTYGKRD